MDGDDAASFYAAKSFYDPVGDRRITWGWLRPDTPMPKSNSTYKYPTVQTNCNSLPREVRYDPRLERLTFFPVDELARLHVGAPLARLARGTPLAEGFTPVPLAAGATPTPGNRSRIAFACAVPATAGRVGVRVLGGTFENGTTYGVDLFVDFAPSPGNATWAVTVGADRTSVACAENLQEGQDWRCAAKSTTMPMLGADTELTIDAWVDNVVVEAFFQGGRTPMALTVPYNAYIHNTEFSVALFTNITGGVEVNNMTVWEMGGIYL